MNKTMQSKAARSFYPVNLVDSCQILLLVSMRRPPDMNVWSGCRAGNRLAKCEKGCHSRAGSPATPGLPGYPDGANVIAL